MSDSEDYEYEYDESDQEAMDAGSNGGGGDDEDVSFEYTDDEDNADNNDGGEVALENAYYNAKTERDDSLTEEEATVTANNLSIDSLANIFGFLGGISDIMHKRRVCKKWKEAVRMTLVPLCRFYINSRERYNAMNVMTRAMPNLQQIRICQLGLRHKWSDGEDLDRERVVEMGGGFRARFASPFPARTANWTTHDIGIISNFRKLRILEIHADLNGRYPFIFSSFPLLQTLSIFNCYGLKWDLEMLARLPMLKELDCESNHPNIGLTGNISSLRVLKDTLEKVRIIRCSRVEGNFMDLADFPHLKTLHLNDVAVTGDIRDIGETDFSSLEQLSLPKGVYGGMGHEFQRISDGPELIRAVYLLKKQRPALKYLWYGKLSRDSPDWYRSLNKKYPPPFNIHFIQAGSRIGYRWDADDYGRNPCEVNWLDPEPDRESSGYEKFLTEMRQIDDDVNLYRGFHQPPTEEEYRRLCGER